MRGKTKRPRKVLLQSLTVVVVLCLGALAAIYLVDKSGPTTSARLAFPGPYHVAGNKILAANGNRFIPYGFVLECLAASQPVDQLCQSTGANSVSGMAQIQAARHYWHADALRFQVSRCTLFDRSPYNTSYLDLVDSLVNATNNLGMVAIVTLQEEECDAKTKPFPDATSVRFWKVVAPHFKDNPDVMFDLFNEPRLAVAGPITENDVWNIWRNGGKVDSGGVDDTFVGMQALVDTVRAAGADNVVVAESNKADSDMSELSTHYLSGQNIAYGVEPNLGRQSDTTTADWNRNFGRYAKVVPVLSEAFLDNVGKRNCSVNSPRLLPKLLNYLQSQGMGLLAWTLESGLYSVGSNLDHPTSYPSSVIDCPRTNAIDPSNTVGPGQDLLGFFAAHSPYSSS
jgi:hypothetical protein